MSEFPETIFEGTSAEEAAKTKQALFVFKNSLATEKHLMEEMKMLFMLPNAPAVKHMGVISSSDDKPFARKSVKLSEVAHQPTQEEMKQIIHEHQSQSSQIFGARKELALQHIHHGYQAFAVSSSGGNGQLVFDGEGVRVFGQAGSKVTKNFNATSEVPMLALAYGQVHSWGMDSDTFAIITAERGGDAGGDAGKLVQYSYTTTSSLIAKNTLDFFCNQKMRVMGLKSVEGSTHGRKVQAREKLELDDVKTGQMIRPPTLAKLSSEDERKLSAVPTLANLKNAPVPPYWELIVKHRGWVRRRGGMLNQWEKLYAILYTTAQGHYLCLYSSDKETPLLTKGAMKEKEVIDISHVKSVLPDPPVPTKAGKQQVSALGLAMIRNKCLTLVVADITKKQEWCRALSEAVEEDEAIVPDENVVFKDLKAKVDTSNLLSKDDYSTAIAISMNGVRLCSRGKEVILLKFLLINQWFTALDNHSKLGLAIVTQPAGETAKHTFFFRTKDALKIASTIEFFITKFLALMRLSAKSRSASTGSNGGGSGSGGSVDEKAAAECGDTAKAIEASLERSMSVMTMQNEPTADELKEASKTGSFLRTGSTLSLTDGTNLNAAMRPNNLDPYVEDYDFDLGEGVMEVEDDDSDDE
jgi:hypothetical protein